MNLAQRILTLRERWINKGRKDAWYAFSRELQKIEKAGHQALANAEKEHRRQLRGVSSSHKATLASIEKNYKKEIKAITAQSDRLNKQLERRIREMDAALEVRDAELYKLKSLSQAARLEAERHNLVGDRVLKEASLLAKAQNEIDSIERTADTVIRKSNKKLKLAQ